MDNLIRPGGLFYIKVHAKHNLCPKGQNFGDSINAQLHENINNFIKY